VEYPREPFNAQAVVDGFVYSSDQNDEWLSEDGLKRMLEA
jgi:hypothetical protein